MLPSGSKQSLNPYTIPYHTIPKENVVVKHNIAKVKEKSGIVQNLVPVKNYEILYHP